MNFGLEVKLKEQGNIHKNEPLSFISSMHHFFLLPSPIHTDVAQAYTFSQ